MPITQFLDRRDVDPEVVDAMSRAFRAACRRLGLADRNDPLNEIVAKRIIELGTAGTRDPRALYKLTIDQFRSSPLQQ